MTTRSHAARNARASFSLAALLLVASCAEGVTKNIDPWVTPVSLSTMGPETLLPGSTMRLEGSGFLDPEFGVDRVHWFGKTRGGDFDQSFEARYVDATHLELDVTPALYDALGGNGGGFGGALRVEVENKAAGSMRPSNGVDYSAKLADSLSPVITKLDTNISIYVDDQVVVEGDGYLLGGNEGVTYARVGGCFYPSDTPGCVGITDQNLPLVPLDTNRRNAGAFIFSFKLTGLRTGVFRGTVTLINQHGADGKGMLVESASAQIELSIQAARVTGVNTTEASLGRYVEVNGGGFVGGDDSAVTLLEVAGDFTPDVTGNARAVDLVLVPEFVSGRLVRYVLNEEDALGSEINLRREFGLFTGTVRPVTRYGEEEQRGEAVPFSFRVAPLKQVVTVVFLPSFVESLGRFGMRAVDEKVRARVLAVAGEPYKGVSIEFRPELPTDFALYSVVELSGRDPNDQGLFGYDNTPGKDTNNQRLTDRIGGVNAQTQDDGAPGYGGVFIESFFEFSKGGLISDPLFDRIFDSFRPSRGGSPITAADLARGFPEIKDGRQCVEKGLDRPTRIACAVFTLGNIVGSTLSHEVGHSLGLANPYDPAEFHDIGDQPLRLMDAGGARPFVERANLDNNGTAEFCDDEYAYLRDIMPSGDAKEIARPTCF